MERRFDMSDFEQSLKDHADQFKLMPSKRVWNGIYNNLHPGSSWPSITVAIVFLITLITVGNLNNSPKRNTKDQAILSHITSENNEHSKQTNNKKSYSVRDALSKKHNDSKQTALLASRQTNNKDSYLGLPTSDNGITDNNAITEKNKTGIIAEKNIGNNNSENILDNSLNTNNKNQKPSQNNFSIINNNVAINGSQEYLREINGNNDDKISNEAMLQQNLNSIINEDELEDFQSNHDDIVLKEAFNSIKNDLIYSVSNNLFSFASDGSLNLNLERNENAPKENLTTLNSEKSNLPGKSTAHSHRKKNKNIQWIFYVAPTITTASFIGKGIEPPVTPNYSPIMVLQTPSSNGMIYNARMGFETGAGINYKLSKKWKLVSGFNLNYSGYNIVSNLLHPTFATLMLKDKSTSTAYSRNYITFYGNGQSINQVSLTNYNLQLSIPVGLQYMIWGNKNIQINIESTIEPLLVLKSNAYIISADKRYYVNDPSLIRKMNLGGNFGSFITFSSRKIKWHIGPDLHYQLLSTYKNYYPVREHLIDYGIRIGISK